ncbi:MerR family transcriptional regulator [Actinokineospora inagensis]|uniref:MerR family transcriptional regulator n=1 Tax=Actinokineospora inagensis TaxID=103730 RepID=UPI000407649A|nr:MerR family transcriptional regulator [Actinokineospora inagensis]
MERAAVDGVVWTAGQVARQLRIAESTLRAWHRRYGVGPHAARAGQYRRYTAEDIARLRRMRDLIDAGTLPSEAARAITAAISAAQALPQVLAAARELDNARCVDLLENVFADVGVVDLWERVCRPALTALDDGPCAEDGIDTEHVLSWAITAVLHRVSRPPTEQAAPVLLACAATEQHTLGLEALAAALAESRVPVRMLGAAVPMPSLVHAAAIAAPAAVVLWAQRPQTAQPDALRALRSFSSRRVIAGPGWPRRPLAGVDHVDSLSAAMTLLTS